MSHANHAMACPPKYSSNLSVLLNMVSYRTYYRIVNSFCSELIIMDAFSYCIETLTRTFLFRTLETELVFFSLVTVFPKLA